MSIDNNARVETSAEHRSRNLFMRIHFWLVWLSFVLLSAAGWMRMVDSITDWYWLDLAGVTPGPLYLALTGALWGAAGLLAALWLLLRFSSGRAAATFIALGIALSYWLDRLFIDQAPLEGSNAPFALLLTLFWLGMVALSLQSWETLERMYRRSRRKERKNS